MTSTIKVNTVKDTASTDIIKKCGTSITVGTASDTTTVAGNAVRSNAIQASDGQNIISQVGTTITLGATGDNIVLAGGATQSGFGRTGTVDWQTTPKTATFTAVSGEGYFANTTGSAFNMNLPAGVAGAIVSVADYAATFHNNNLTVVPNGTDKIGSVNANAILSTKGQSITFVFVDSTQGWINTMDSTSNVRGVAPIETLTATGGNTTLIVGDYKTHIFTGPGTFTVCSVGGPTAGVEYLVVAGAGGSGRSGGGGGAGGLRIYSALCAPISAPAHLPVTAQGYPIVVGAGGSGGDADSSVQPAMTGSNSSFSTITSAGGGGAANYSTPSGALGGGSGGGAGPAPGGGPNSGGAGNTPPVSPSQGNTGGSASNPGGARSMGGGGGGGAVGTPGGPGSGGCGGVGSYVPDEYFGPTAPTYGTPGPVSSVRYFAGGGAGGRSGGPGTAVIGGAGGGGNGGQGTSSSGSVNTGGGAGAGNCVNGGSGGSGAVIIRYKFQ